jgi:hypothetical protein
MFQLALVISLVYQPHWEYDMEPSKLNHKLSGEYTEKKVLAERFMGIAVPVN